MQISTHLEQQVKATVEGLGYAYVGSETSSDSMPLLRIYVEGADLKPLTMGEITVISRQLNALFDVESPWNGHYRVEVSSPGLDRRLFSLEDFQRFTGQEVKLKLHRPVDERKKWVGLIKEVAENNVVLEVEGSTRIFAFDTIEKAHLVPKLKW